MLSANRNPGSPTAATLALVVCLLSPGARAEEGDPSLEVPHRRGEIAVDGDLADWSGPSAAPALPGTRLTWDRAGLYLAFQVADDDPVCAVEGEPDPFAVDAVEIRVDVDRSGGAFGPGDVRMLVGCDGSVLVYRGSEPSADGRTVLAGVDPGGGLAAAVVRDGEGFRAEVALPFTLIGIDRAREGVAISIDLAHADAPGTDGGAGRVSRSWAELSGQPWPRLELSGGPTLAGRLTGSVHPGVLALGLALLLAIGVAFELGRRQRRERSRFDALAARLDEIERVSAPTLEVALSDPSSASTASLTVAPPPTASISLSATASLITVLRTGFTILPFEEAAKDLAARIAELEATGEDPVGADEWQALAEMAVAYVKANLTEPLAVGELAKALHLTPRTLQRGIRRGLTCTPRELILAVRMTEAKRLLKTGVLRVSEVGYQVGFGDPAHFSRRFKAYFRCTPSEFAQQYRDAARGEERP